VSRGNIIKEDAALIKPPFVNIMSLAAYRRFFLYLVLKVFQESVPPSLFVLAINIKIWYTYINIMTGEN